MASRKLLTLIAAICFAILLILPSGEGAFMKHSKRQAPSEEPLSDCENSPCGWAVYTPFTRQVDYFMKNKCECPKEKKCIRTDDDISVSAFVYRCRPSSPPPTTPAPSSTASQNSTSSSTPVQGE